MCVCNDISQCGLFITYSTISGVISFDFDHSGCKNNLQLGETNFAFCSAKAKSDLKSAVDKAAGGSSAVAVTAEMKGGKPVASIVLSKGGKLETVTQPLD